MSNFIGVIESRNDPLKMGRLQIRIFGIHSEDKTLIPSDQLPWASVLNPINNSNPSSIPEGSWVMGTYLDEDKQMPIVMGSFIGIPEVTPTRDKGFSDQRSDDDLMNSPTLVKKRTYKTDGTGVQLELFNQAVRYPDILNLPSNSELARNGDNEPLIVTEKKSNKVTKVAVVSDGNEWNEPEIPYETKYPYNRVIETESGHVFEMDDTPKAERIHLWHRSGSFMEIHPNGDVVIKDVADKYSIIMKSDHVFVMGNQYVTIQGNRELRIQGDSNIKVDKDASVHIIGDSTVSIDGNLDVQVNGDVSLQVNGAFDVTADLVHFTGDLKVDGDVVAHDISLDNHTHSGVQTGSGSTGSPQ